MEEKGECFINAQGCHADFHSSTVQIKSISVMLLELTSLNYWYDNSPKISDSIVKINIELLMLNVWHVATLELYSPNSW